MSDDLKSLERWAGALLSKLEPSARRSINMQVARDLRRSQQQRIKAQLAPDASPYTPRKNRKKLRDKQGRIKKKKAAMFTKITQAKSFRVTADQNQIGVGFFARVARIARVHQFGLKDKVSQNGPEVVYEKRQLLGLSDVEKEKVRDSMLKHLEQTRHL
ncbi:phage virion morphogenesis protein [Undibacterium danionis]|uniref:Phage virion morphogenesis protein n=1 Tax=Undibacterium danionis TaxID=1812100 RepID=A0ABV6IJ06_9BURK